MTTRPDDRTWIEPAVIEALHADLMQEHGGRPGLRDRGLLALERNPMKDVAALAAAYAFSVATRRPFVDGNEATALMVAYTFLALNGATLEALETDAACVIRGLALGAVTEKELADWVRAHARRRAPVKSPAPSPGERPGRAGERARP